MLQGRAECAKGPSGLVSGEAEFIVGIDLGTSHTAVAFSPIDAKAVPEILGISQLVGASELARRPLLPSSLYLPLEYEA